MSRRTAPLTMAGGEGDQDVQEVGAPPAASAAARGVADVRRSTDDGRAGHADDPASPMKSIRGSRSMADELPLAAERPTHAAEVVLRGSVLAVVDDGEATSKPLARAAVHRACGEYIVDPSPTTHSTGSPQRRAHADTPPACPTRPPPLQKK